MLVLDDTVALERIRPKRNSEGHLTLERVYRFEYSDTGASRSKGSVVVLGSEVLLVHIGAHSTLFEPPLENP